MAPSWCDWGGGGFIEKQNVFHVPGIRSPLYFLRQRPRLLGCGYIGGNKGNHMCFPSFDLIIDDRLENLVNYKYLFRTYIYIVRDYKKPKIIIYPPHPS